MNTLIISLNGQSFEFLAKKLAQVDVACDFADATTPMQDFGASQTYDAIIVHCPRCDDKLAEAVKALRNHDLHQPLLTLSEFSEWYQRVAVLDAGSDDHLDFPVRSDELAARLRAVCRRSIGHTKTIFEIGDFRLDMNSKTVMLGGQMLDLTRNEYRLLQTFLTKHEQIVTSNELQLCLYTDDMASRSANAVQVHICRLRAKIGSSRIHTARGLGYRINARGEDQVLQC